MLHMSAFDGHKTCINITPYLCSYISCSVVFCAKNDLYIEVIKYKEGMQNKYKLKPNLYTKIYKNHILKFIITDNFKEELLNFILYLLKHLYT